MRKCSLHPNAGDNMKKVNCTTARKRKSAKNISVKVTRKFLSEYLLADRLYTLISRQLNEKSVHL